MSPRPRWSQAGCRKEHCFTAGAPPRSPPPRPSHPTPQPRLAHPGPTAAMPSTGTPHTIHSTGALLPSRSLKPTLILQAWSAARTGPHSATPTALPAALHYRSSLTGTSPLLSTYCPQTCCFTRYMQTLCFRHTKTEYAKRVPFGGWTGRGSPESHLPPLGVASGLELSASRLRADAPAPSTSTFS